jgi:transposase
MRGEVLVGPERRRRWSEDEKSRIVEASIRPGVQVADVARRYGVSRSLVYAWRREARCTPASAVVPPEPAFVPVLLSAAEDSQTAAAPLETADPDRASRRAPKRRTANGGEIEVVLPGGARVTLRGRIEATALRAVLAALKA